MVFLAGERQQFSNDETCTYIHAYEQRCIGSVDKVCDQVITFMQHEYACQLAEMQYYPRTVTGAIYCCLQMIICSFVLYSVTV